MKPWEVKYGLSFYIRGIRKTNLGACYRVCLHDPVLKKVTNRWLGIVLSVCDQVH